MLDINNYNSSDHILVSIFCATYNHELYISEAIEGFLSQKTNFKFEILIFEDKSTDSTTEILKEYERKYPGFLTVTYHNENMYSQKIDFFATEFLQMATGKYIAICEGDDYWTDPYKLQKQIDFLENNIDYVGCIHDAKFIGLTEYYPQNKFTIWSENEKIDIHTIFQRGGGCYPTASFVFRMPKNKIDFILFVKPYLAGDSALIFYLLKFGNIYHLKEQMCVYRVHRDGVYSSIIHNPLKLIEMEYNSIELLKATKRHLKQYYSSINSGISICINNIFEQAFNTGSSRTFTRAIILVTKYSPIIYPFFNYKNLIYLSTVFMFRKVKYQVRKFSNSQ